MYLSKADTLIIQDLVKMIDSVLGAYDEDPYDQIDNLRSKTCEISDILDCGSYDIDSSEDIREEQLQTNVYDFCEPIEN